jgi:glutamate-1-semialdehyde 2,1-aminomutase
MRSPKWATRRPCANTYTLKDMDDDWLRVLRGRRDIACVLVNPLQALHPNRGAPGDGSLIDSGRSAGFDYAAYAAWLGRLREVCSARGIVLIFDEILVGFRLAPGGAQEYFGVRADMVTYGKTVAGGFPVGVLCGRASLMRRFDEERPRTSFRARYVQLASLRQRRRCGVSRRLRHARLRACYVGLDKRWSRAQRLNEALEIQQLPVRVANLTYGRWLARALALQLDAAVLPAAEGLALSWIGTGRLIFSLNYTEADFEAVMQRFVAAARAMERDGWWWAGAGLSNKSIKRGILREMIAQRL